MNSLIQLSDPAEDSARIVQLYEHLELYSWEKPPRNTLFILGRAPMSVMSEAGDQLLLIDPQADAAQRFVLPGQCAVLSTTNAQSTALPHVESAAGGNAHLRIGEHFIDIYSHAGGNSVHLPALGVVCSGAYASDVALPALAAESAGESELDTLRILVQLVKQPNFQLLIPERGSTVADRFEAITRLAADVAYLHGLRRAAETGDTVRSGEALLPADRRSRHAHQVHTENLRQMGLHS